MRVCLSLFFILIFLSVKSQFPGSGNTLDFDGNNDYVQLNSSFGSIAFPMTLTTWYKPASGQSGPVRFFTSHNMSGAYRGLLFQYINGVLNVQCGNGTSRSPSGRWGFVSSLSFNPGRWYHITAVLYSANSAQFYIDGIPVATNMGNGIGVRNLASNSSNGRIGANVAGNVSYLKGQLDEFTFWDKALTQQEIRSMMCRKLSGTEPGLLAYYRFDDGTGTSLTNYKPGGPGGTLVNGPSWVSSSAPVGDRSFYSYNGTDVSGTSLTGDSILVDPAPGGTNGTQLYFVDMLPASIAGIVLPAGVNYYFGVFNAFSNKNYDLSLFPGSVTGSFPNTTLKLAKRPHNAASPWIVTGSTNNPDFQLISQNAISQFIISDDPCMNFQVDVGNDTTVCDFQKLKIGRARVPGESYQWSTGAGTDSISIDTSGTYWLQVTRPGCVESDTVQIVVHSSKANYLPEDSISCDSMEVRVTGPLKNFLWSNAATTNSTTIFSSSILWFSAVDSVTGCTINDTLNATVVPTSAIANLSLDTTICGATSFSYAISTTNASGYLWSDGDTNSVRHFNASDTLWFRRFFGGNCEKIDTLKFRLAPEPDYLPKDTLACDSLTLQVSGPLTNIMWSNTSSGNTTLVTTPGATWFQATDSLTGCTVDDTINVVLVQRALKKQLSLDTTLCDTRSFTYDISTNGAESYLWQDGDTSSIRSFSSSDTLWFTRSFTTNCSITDTLALRFAPRNDYLPADTTVCDSVELSVSGTLKNIMWSNGGRGFSILAVDTGKVWFTAIDSLYGCTVSDTIEVDIIHSSQIPSLSLDTVLCGLTSFTYDISTPGVTSYSWSDNSSQVVRNFSQDGTYYFTRIFAGICERTDTLQLKFSQTTEPLAEDEFYICDDDTVKLALPANTYQAIIWSNGSNDPETGYWQPGDYWVETQNPDGCWHTDSFSVLLSPSMDSVQIFNDTSFCAGEGVLLSAPEGFKVRWPNGRGGNYFVGRSQDVRVEISDGCTKSVEFFKISEYSCECDVRFPNAFTPNGDGLNDLFGPATKCEFVSFRLEVFNRFGNLIFSSNSPQRLFDGSMDGKDLPLGVYTFIFTYSTPEKSGNTRGYFSLLR